MQGFLSDLLKKANRNYDDKKLNEYTQTIVSFNRHQLFVSIFYINSKTQDIKNNGFIRLSRNTQHTALHLARLKPHPQNIKTIIGTIQREIIYLQDQKYYKTVKMNTNNIRNNSENLEIETETDYLLLFTIGIRHRPLKCFCVFLSVS